MKSLLKTVYAIVPFKRALFSVLKIFWKPKEHIYKHLHFHGVIKVYVDRKKYFKIKHFGYHVENKLFWEGLTKVWEKESIKLWIKLCENADVVFDIGANTGVYSLITKTVNPNATVYAFEPVERVFDKLIGNIVINDFDIIPVEKAVSNYDGTAIIYDTDTEHTYSVTVNKNMAAPETIVFQKKVPTITLNTFIRDTNIQKVDLMKIDVETHEPEVLEGFSDYLFKFRPTLLIEILNDEIGNKINMIMKDQGYLYFNIDEKGGIVQVSEITKSNYYNYLLCMPEVAERIGLINSGTF